MTRYLFVTGKLAEPSLRRLLADLGPRIGIDYEIAVLNISVAALMTPAWVARHLRVPEGIDVVMLPGYCSGDLTPVASLSSARPVLGPKDLRDLPEHFGRKPRSDYGKFDIEILAEINNCPRLRLAEVLTKARQYRDAGADIIDLGCTPGEVWTGVGDAVRALRQEGMRVSIDSYDPREIAPAVAAGAELVLSVNSSNVDAAGDWGCEVVAIPDEPATLRGLDAVVERLAAKNVRFRIDPIVEPIGFGFAASLGRYLEVRRRYPQADMLMGVGNLTELTDVDSAGVNVLLAGFCQETGIRSVLTTEVINWCRSSIRELDLARRLVYFACRNRVPPKHVETGLVMLRDPKLRRHSREELAELAGIIRDKNFRIFTGDEQIHVINQQVHLEGIDPFSLFQQMTEGEDISPSHAFYLGYEMAKAVIALTLGKDYTQDQELRWGLIEAETQADQELQRKT